MSKRPPESSVPFGLVAWLENTKISLPLKGVECRFDVTAGIASVEVDQIFYQSHSAALDCTYTFPLPAEAAVFRCEMHVNDRVIVARVEERGEARRIFTEQKAAGHRAAMVEVERDNLFTLTLGNAQPEDVIVIRLAYFQVLERAGDTLSARIPVCPGVRYIPGNPLLRSLSGKGTQDDTDEVPDASRISPPRIDALHPDAAYFSIEGKIARSDVAESTLSSPTHTMLVHQGSDAYSAALAQNGAVPDRDFVMRWKEAADTALEPRGWATQSGKDRYALVQLRAPKNVPVTTDIPHDYYFLVDRSGSMLGAKWTKTCEAVIAFVKLLGDRDRVWITLFESRFQDFAEAPLPAASLLRDDAFLHLEKRGAHGGTKLRPAAEHLLDAIQKHSAEDAAAVILITDGQVGNERDILAKFHQTPSLAVHTFGIDTAVNDAFLKTLARQQHGRCWLQTPDDDIAGTVAGLAETLRRPVITSLEIRGAWKPAVASLPALHAGETREISLRLETGTDEPLEISGRLPDGTRHAFSIALAAVGNAALPLLWARERITTLLAEGKQSEAITLAKAHNIVCEGAAFVAWDEAEKVNVATREIYQPSLDQAVAGERLRGGPTLARRSGSWDSPASSLEDAAACESIPCASPPSSTRYCVRPGISHPVSSEHEAKKEPETIAQRLEEAGIDHMVAMAFELWADKDWSTRAKCIAALEDLITSLGQPGISVSDRVRLCREFIDLHLRDEETVMKSILVKFIEGWRVAAGV